MILKKCFLTENRCYIKAEKITDGKPTGIVVHSTGANNPKLNRYIRPITPGVSEAEYNTIIADIGKGSSNHWNQSKASVCVHAFIGKNLAGQVETYQTLPFDICCWGCGKSTKGSYNYNPTAHIQFEICEDTLDDESYFAAAFKEAIEFCAHLCKTYNIPVNKIVSHAEAHKEGYASNHSDAGHWLKIYGKDMNWFRDEVQKILTPPVLKEEVVYYSAKYKIDDVIQFNGSKQYTNANATASKNAKPNRVKITKISAKGKHPYHVRSVNSSDIFISGVYGWVDEADLEAIVPYKVKVTASSLNYRKGPGILYAKVGTIKDKGVYTIVEEKNGWGKLKSGVGWISLNYTKKL